MRMHISRTVVMSLALTATALLLVAIFFAVLILPHLSRANAINRITQANGEVSWLRPDWSWKIGSYDMSGYPIGFRVTMVRINNANVADDVIESILSFPEVEELQLSGCILPDGASRVLTLSRMRQLDLTESNIHDEFFNDISNPDLEFLAVRGTSVSDVGLEHISSLSKLKVLCIDGTRISASGIGVLGKCRSLEVLDVSDTGMTDDSMKVFAELPKLTSIFLSGTKITDTGLRTVVMSRSIKSITVTNTLVSKAAVEEIKTRFPQLNVVDAWEENETEK